MSELEPGLELASQNDGEPPSVCWEYSIQPSPDGCAEHSVTEAEVSWAGPPQNKVALSDSEDAASDVKTAAVEDPGPASQLLQASAQVPEVALSPFQVLFLDRRGRAYHI